MTDKEKYVFEIILQRRSVRNFIVDKPVEKWKITKMLEAAMAAPSACNTQPWEFIVVSENDKMDKLRNAMGDANRFNAPMAIITCANPTYIPWEGNGWMIDCSAAVENMLIAATAMGLASVWIGWCHEDILRETFEIPTHIHFLNTVYFGYTDNTQSSGTRYAEDAVFLEKYDPTRIRPPKKVVEYGPMKMNDLSVNPPTSWED
jgi:nitroreductase